MSAPPLDARSEDDLRHRLKWFLLGRVAVISCFFAIVAAAVLGGAHGRAETEHILLVVAVTYAVSGVSALLLPRIRRLRGFTLGQVAFDVLLVSGVIHLTGGLESPFGVLYCLPIINAAVLLFGAGALFAAIAAAVAYDALLLVDALGAWTAAPAAPLDQIVLRAASTNLTFALIALLSSVLTRRLADTERQLQQKQAERDHFALLQDTLARTINSGLVTTDAEGRITAVDIVAAELAHRAPSELIGRDIGAIFAPLKLTAAARLAFLQSSAAADAIEFSHMNGDSRPRQLRCVAAPLANTFGLPIGALYVLQNVSDIQQDLPTASAAAELPDEALRVDLDTASESVEAADGLYGASPAMARLRELVDRMAAADATVLITGESGTGKEVVARAIHARGPRRDKRFVAVNCGAIPESLIESELFGHVRGAFTGAVTDRPGCFRMADGGTLFLDEIGELPLHLQVKLLRVLQERTFRPVGGETSVAVDVRIMAATNRDLLAETKAGRFREDLFYRLNVLACALPPLRDRREDIPLLVRHFLRQFSDLHGRRVNRLSVGAGRLLLRHDYPGNVRELENVIEHAVALCDADTATEEHLPVYLIGDTPPRATPPLRPGPPPASITRDSEVAASWPALREPALSAKPFDLVADLAAYEKVILLRALDQAGGVKKRAAELLGINYRSLRHRLQKYGLGDTAEDAPAQAAAN
ncbi:MAG: sigma-54 interaction domain-containing protein [Candidatus Binatia bacterium]